MSEAQSSVVTANELTTRGPVANSEVAIVNDRVANGRSRGKVADQNATPFRTLKSTAARQAYNCKMQMRSSSGLLNLLHYIITCIYSAPGMKGVSSAHLKEFLTALLNQSVSITPSNRPHYKILSQPSPYPIATCSPSAATAAGSCQ